MKLLFACLLSLPLLGQSVYHRATVGPVDVLTLALGPVPAVLNTPAAESWAVLISLDHFDRTVTAFRVRCTVELSDGQRLPVDQMALRIDGGRAFTLVNTYRLAPIRLLDLKVTPHRPDSEITVPLTSTP